MRYAIGPNGIIKGNRSVNTVCGKFTIRPEPTDRLVDGGGNVEESTSGPVILGSRVCYSDPKLALERFKADHSVSSAYAVALAYGETVPIKNEVTTLAWVMIAAEMGHSDAKTQTTLAYPPGVWDAARAMVMDIRHEIPFSGGRPECPKRP